jgi:hypothetical protein
MLHFNERRLCGSRPCLRTVIEISSASHSLNTYLSPKTAQDLAILLFSER